MVDSGGSTNTTEEWCSAFNLLLWQSASHSIVYQLGQADLGTLKSAGSDLLTQS